MLEPVVEQFARYAPGEPPLLVFNAHTGEENYPVWMLCSTLTNDIRAIKDTTCGRSPPCYVGSCNFCDVPGQRHLRTTTVPGSVRALAPGHHDIFRMLLLPVHVQIAYTCYY